jgi:uncharacterized cupredoxin-like copper-binding protein
MNADTRRRIVTYVAAGLAASGISAAHEGHGDKKSGPQAVPIAETAFGRAADPAKAKRIVRVEMSDAMRYTPDRVTVKRGESVRFVVTNRGQVPHEMVLGTKKELEAHAELMKKHPGMEHDQPYMLHVPPGRTYEMGWQFTKAGEFHFGCLIPGHFEAGMKGRVIVTDD